MPLDHLGINVPDVAAARIYYDELMPLVGFASFFAGDDWFSYAPADGPGTQLFFYTAQAQPLLTALGEHHQLRTLHRPANLEDLFLKLTGRQIREDG